MAASLLETDYHHTQQSETWKWRSLAGTDLETVISCSLGYGYHSQDYHMLMETLWLLCAETRKNGYYLYMHGYHMQMET